ncbi:hypothetical protein O71_11544 [Pontibacter sp. BAB1700]|nr:hypothetical protein O71_11544 [Pontibacter sp. BAB1700]
MYWNARTQKWLVKPIRESTVGQTKGKTDRERLAAIKAAHPERWRSHAYLPINLTVAQVEADSATHWPSTGTKFEIDRALALSTLLINKSIRKVTNKDNSRLHSMGYVGVPSSDLSNWVGSDYKRYLEFFQSARYITCYSSNGATDFYFNGRHSKYYRFQQRLITCATDVRKYHRVEYATDKMLVKASRQRKKDGSNSYERRDGSNWWITCTASQQHSMRMASRHGACGITRSSGPTEAYRNTSTQATGWHQGTFMSHPEILKENASIPYSPTTRKSFGAMSE